MKSYEKLMIVATQLCQDPSFNRDVQELLEIMDCIVEDIEDTPYNESVGPKKVVDGIDNLYRMCEVIQEEEEVIELSLEE